jgi:2'-5' RNA ligase
MTERLFVAVVPPRAVRDAWDAFLEHRRDAAPELRWVLPDAWHLTCAFMARVRPELEDDLAEALQVVGQRTAPFALSVGGAGAFPHPDAAKVLWWGATDGATELGELAVRCRNAAVGCGIEVDGARFRPHLTIARANGLRALRWLEALDTMEPQAWQVTSFRLVRSLLLPGGAGYQTVGEFRLGG